MSCVVHTCVVWTVGSKGLCGEVLGCRDGQLLGTVVVRACVVRACVVRTVGSTGLCCVVLCYEDGLGVVRTGGLRERLSRGPVW